MSYTFFTREQVADVLTRIGNEELATRYLNNTSRRVVITENPVKNSFDWSTTPEGVNFWKSISSAFDAALASGEVAVVGEAMSEKKAFTILERDVNHNPLDFLKKEFAAPAAGSSDERSFFAEFIKKLLGISEEEGVDSDDDFDDMPTPSSKTSSEKFAEEMAQYVVREAIKRSLIKSKK